MRDCCLGLNVFRRSHHFRRCSAHDGGYASLPEKWGKRINSKVQNSDAAAAASALECGSSLKRNFLVYLDYDETYLLISV